jgi:SAM-dependent methyltransferase
LQIIKDTTRKLHYVVTIFLRFAYGDPPLRTIFAPDYLHLKAIYRFVSEFLTSLSSGQSILDIGCGDQRFKKFVPKTASYICLDYEPTKRKHYKRIPDPDIIGDVRALPIESNSFDRVLCTEVLEHVSEPISSITEMVRILKPNGKLILTVPFLFPEHDTPHDFHRYTLYGIKYDCERVGLKVVKIVKLGGVGTMLIGLLTRISHNLVTSTALGKLFFYFPGIFIFPLFYLTFNMIGYLLDHIKSSPFYIGIGLVCRKR